MMRNYRIELDVLLVLLCIYTDPTEIEIHRSISENLIVISDRQASSIAGYCTFDLKNNIAIGPTETFEDIIKEFLGCSMKLEDFVDRKMRM